MNAKAIIESLRVRYSAPEWAGFAELRDATGFGASRTIDYFAANTYPSKGRLFVAVEVKVDRGDFARELANPNKRAPWLGLATECYFAAPTGLLKSDEIPEGWGLLECSPKSEKIRRRKIAVQRPDAAPDEALWISIARRCAEAIDDRLDKEAPYASFRGREVTIADIERLAEHLRSRPDWKLELDAKARAREMRAEDVRKHREFWEPREAVVTEAERLACMVDPSISSWRADPKRVAEALRGIRSVGDPDAIASALRQAADLIERRTGARASALIERLA